MLAEDAIKAALNDYIVKQSKQASGVKVSETKTGNETSKDPDVVVADRIKDL